jgi:hypothetical protein
MKKKTLGTLKLSRETVRRLEDHEIAGVAGGYTRQVNCTIATYVCSGCHPCL